MGIDTIFWKGCVYVNINSYCYLGLGFISIILLFYVCYKTGVRRALLTFMAMVGLGYIIEAVIYNLLDSYQYYPKIIKHNPVYDSNLGAIASNALSLPAVAAYLVAFRKTWLWFVVMIGVFAGIEWTFLELHIYKHHWWKIRYTSLGLPGYFIFAKILYQKIAQPLKGFSHTLFLYLLVSPFVGTFHIPPIMLFSNRIINWACLLTIQRIQPLLGPYSI